jgi:hypothetical protein
MKTRKHSTYLVISSTCALRIGSIAGGAAVSAWTSASVQRAASAASSRVLSLFVCTLWEIIHACYSESRERQPRRLTLANLITFIAASSAPSTVWPSAGMALAMGTSSSSVSMSKSSASSRFIAPGSCEAGSGQRERREGNVRRSAGHPLFISCAKKPASSLPLQCLLTPLSSAFISAQRVVQVTRIASLPCPHASRRRIRASACGYPQLSATSIASHRLQTAPVPPNRIRRTFSCTSAPLIAASAWTRSG